MSIRLLLVVPAPVRCEWLKSVFEKARNIAVVGAGPDPRLASISAPEAVFANLIIVDLSAPLASHSGFWVTLHVLYPTAPIMAMVDDGISELALQAALHAGVYCFARHNDKTEQLHEAVSRAHAGRRFYSASWLMVVVQKLIQKIELSTPPIKGVDGLEHKFRSQYHLTRLEAAVFVYLYGREGELVSPAELTAAVWKQNPSIAHYANQVRCCLKRLRYKLDANPKNMFELSVVHGQGYRLRKTGRPDLLEMFPENYDSGLLYEVDQKADPKF